MTLGKLKARTLDTDSAYVGAWGSPAVILRCGVAKPDLNDPNQPQLIDIDNVQWLPNKQTKPTVFTTVDRSVAIDVTLGTKYLAGDLLPLLAASVKALPAVCSASDQIGQQSTPGLPTCGA